MLRLQIIYQSDIVSPSLPIGPVIRSDHCGNIGFPPLATACMNI
jgi:hypothetical protein